MHKIVFLPLDERPCNKSYPVWIGGICGAELSVLPENYMGRFKNAADVEALWQWTLDQVKGASHLIVSMDMAIYGGIVPSRLHHLSEEVCKERILRLKKVRELQPDIKIYAFQLITRAPARDGSGEEPDYYEDYGYRIYRYGVITDRQSVGIATDGEQKELEQIKRETPEEYLEDFLKRRAVNFENQIRTIELVEKGVIDHLIIPLDDCKAYGYAPSERKRLSSILAEKNLLSCVSMYPGADEVGCTLLARAINAQRGITPAVYVDYSSLRGRLQIPSYEDRSIGESVLCQIYEAGCVEAETSAEADFVLAVHPPTEFSLRLEKEIESDAIILESERNLPAFLARIRMDTKKGIPVGVADCAIPNGADRALMQCLYEQGLLKTVTAYGGWNTSSNTLGTVIAHMTAWNAAKQDGESTAAKLASDRCLFLRYLEDWGYMAEVRKTLTKQLAQIDPSLNRLDLKDQEPVVRELVKERLERFQNMYFPDSRYRYHVRLPWNRMFEVEIELIP